jgi:hypothetical protein
MTSQIWRGAEVSVRTDHTSALRVCREPGGRCRDGNPSRPDITAARRARAQRGRRVRRFARGHPSDPRAKLRVGFASSSELPAWSELRP